jgi:hypothetical protein
MKGQGIVLILIGQAFVLEAVLAVFLVRMWRELPRR